MTKNFVSYTFTRDEVFFRGSTLIENIRHIRINLPLIARNVCSTYPATGYAFSIVRQINSRTHFAGLPLKGCFQPVTASLCKIRRCYSFRSVSFSFNLFFKSFRFDDTTDHPDLSTTCYMRNISPSTSRTLQEL